MNTLDYIIKKYDIIDQNGKLPIEIPNMGRNDLANLIHELDFKIGVEIGVAEGNYSKKLCKANPQMHIYGVDMWKEYENYIDDNDSGRTFDMLYAKAQRQLSPFKNYEIIRDYSMNAVERFENWSLDFVYLDANHEYSHISEDIVEWSKKVRSGGIVSGHDYYNHFDVIKAIQNYTKNNNIKPWFVLGLSIKKYGLIRDTVRSWLYVKS